MKKYQYKVREASSAPLLEGWINALALEGYELDKLACGGDSRVVAVMKKVIKISTMQPTAPDGRRRA